MFLFASACIDAFTALRFVTRADYESKVDARNRSHLKGRVQVASVKLEKTSRSGHGFDFSFETNEGKVFHCSVPTQFDQLTWVYFLEVRASFRDVLYGDERREYELPLHSYALGGNVFCGTA